MSDSEATETDAALERRDTRQVIDDHIQCRQDGDIERDIARNYAADVVVLTSNGPAAGHDAVRHYDAILRKHVPHDYEIITEDTHGRFGFIAWRAREPGKSVEDGADSFVVENGRIVFQSIHYSIQQVMPD